MDTLNINSLKKKLFNEKMVKIPSGEILMRDDRKKETWNVKIETFFLAQFPVTQSLYYLDNTKNTIFF